MRRFKIHVIGLLFLSLLTVNCEAKEPIGFLKEGTVWKYVGMIKNNSTTEGKNIPVDMERAVYPKRKMGGQEIIPLKSTANNITTFTFYGEDADGIYIYAQQEPTDIEPEIIQGKHYILKYPLRIGNSWNYSNSKGENLQYSIVAEEKVIVPAGDFKCLKIKAAGKTDASGQITYLESYRWISSANGIIVKEYLDYNVYEKKGYLSLQPDAGYTISIQLSSISKK